MGTKPMGTENVQRVDLTAQAAIPEVNKAVKQYKAPKKEGSLLYDFAALDGLRVVACLSVICFHSFLYWGTLLDINEGEQVCLSCP
jgi:hypothetical protein